MVVLSTADPAKFPEAVRAAAGVDPYLPPSAEGLAGKPEFSAPVIADGQFVGTAIVRFSGVGLGLGVTNPALRTALVRAAAASARPSAKSRRAN